MWKIELIGGPLDGEYAALAKLDPELKFNGKAISYIEIKQGFDKIEIEQNPPKQLFHVYELHEFNKYLNRAKYIYAGLK